MTRSYLADSFLPPLPQSLSCLRRVLFPVEPAPVFIHFLAACCLLLAWFGCTSLFLCLLLIVTDRKKRKAEDEVDGGAPLKKAKSPEEEKEEKDLKVDMGLDMSRSYPDVELRFLGVGLPNCSLS